MSPENRVGIVADQIAVLCVVLVALCFSVIAVKLVRAEVRWAKTHYASAEH